MKQIIKNSLIAVLLLGLIAPLHAGDKPNIILLFSDDAGYADFGFQGSEVMKTPNLDKFRKQGVKFEQAYVTAAVCGPSRAGLITGKYQQRFGYEENNVPGYMDNNACMTDDDMGLPVDEVTMGQYMKGLGYNTAYFGKWHLGNADRFHPTKRGFDYFYGFRGGARSYFTFNEGNPNYRQEDYLERGFGDFKEADEYLTHALVDDAIKYIEEQGDEPFFLILAFNAVHTPMEPEEELLNMFPELSGNRQKLAAMTYSMDVACGKLLKKLDKLKLDDNTLVVYANDNGGPESNSSNNKPLSGAKASPLEGGLRVPFLMRWPGVLDKNSNYSYPISTLDLLPTFYAAAGGEVDSLKGIDGVNLMPYILGENTERPHETLYWKKENRGVIREGDWKLIRFPDRPAELFYLPDDIGEMNNLAAEHPDKVKELYSKLFAWERTLARPKWQLKRYYEGAAMDRMDTYRK